MSPDREDLHRELDAATDHPRAFIEAIVDYTPTISTTGSWMTIVFDEPEQAAEILDLLWAAINSAKSASTGEEA